MIKCEKKPSIPWSSTGLFIVLSLREHVFGREKYCSAPVTRWLDFGSPVHSQWHWSETCLGNWGKLVSTGYTGASKKHAPVYFYQTVTVSDCQRLLFGFSVTGYTGATSAVHPDFLGSLFPTARGASPLYISRPPGSFIMPLTHWIPEATLEKKREVFGAIEWRSSDCKWSY